MNLLDMKLQLIMHIFMFLKTFYSMFHCYYFRCDVCCVILIFLGKTTVFLLAR